jgi:hypothetical protein
LNTIAAIADRKAGFRSLGDAWADTTTTKELIAAWEDLPVSTAIDRGIDSFAAAGNTDEPTRMMLVEARSNRLQACLCGCREYPQAAGWRTGGHRSSGRRGLIPTDS